MVPDFKVGPHGYEAVASATRNTPVSYMHSANNGKTIRFSGRSAREIKGSCFVAEAMYDHVYWDLGRVSYSKRILIVATLHKLQFCHAVLFRINVLTW